MHLYIELSTLIKMFLKELNSLQHDVIHVGYIKLRLFDLIEFKV